MIRYWISLVVLVFGYFMCANTQDDFSSPITCYKCMGTLVNSSCSDPFNVENKSVKDCPQGLCIKWTRKLNGVWYMERTCSDDLTIFINLIDRVCRTERNGNGYLCMCGKRLCNSANHPVISSVILQATLVSLLVVVCLLQIQY